MYVAVNCFWQKYILIYLYACQTIQSKFVQFQDPRKDPVQLIDDSLNCRMICIYSKTERVFYLQLETSLIAVSLMVLVEIMNLIFIWISNSNLFLFF